MSGWVPGLAGVVAAQTSVSRVDGERGRLWFRGRPAGDVAAGGFEAAADWVLQRELADLGAARVRAHRRQGPAPLPGMAGVRALVAGAESEHPVDLIAEVAIAVVRVAQSSVAPDPTLDHAADLLRMLGLTEGSEALGRYLATVMDHGLNASTFAARVVASTGSDRVSAVTAAIGALKGPLHGGAPGPVLDMLDAVGTPDRAEVWVEQELCAGRRIMGMGHRVYRVRDPRAASLEAALHGLRTDRLAIAFAVEAAAERALARRHPGRSLRANVEFYTAILLDAIGLPRDLFTPLFAAGRVVGWLAHIEEERGVGRIIRPRAEYVGPACV